MFNTIQTEIDNLEIPNQGNSNVNKELYYHNNYTDYTFERDNTIHKYGNRRTFIIQQNMLHINDQETNSHKSNHLIIVHYINTSSPPPDNNGPEIDTM